MEHTNVLQQIWQEVQKSLLNSKSMVLVLVCVYLWRMFPPASRNTFIQRNEWRWGMGAKIVRNFQHDFPWDFSKLKSFEAFCVACSKAQAMFAMRILGE